MFAQLLISGLALGSIYALLGIALVLVNKATDVVNFAQGEMAMFTTFLAFVLISHYELPLLLVFLLAPIIGGLMGAAIERIVMRPLASGPPVNAIITTIGLWIIFNHTAGWIWGYDPYRFPSLFPSESMSIGAARISPNSIGTIAVALVVMGALYLFFEHTREGTAMRAASINRRAAKLMGINVNRVSLYAWALGAALGTICGMLVAPMLFLDFEMMGSVLLKAFAGAIIGGFNSMPGVVAGSMIVAVAETFFGGYVSSEFKDAFAFVAIVLVLMVRPTGLFGRKGVIKV